MLDDLVLRHVHGFPEDAVLRYKYHDINTGRQV